MHTSLCTTVLMYCFRSQLINEGASTSTSTSAVPHTFPALYVLPDFPPYLTDKLDRQREAVKSDEKTTNLITRILMEDMQQYYPDDQMYVTARIHLEFFNHKGIDGTNCLAR